MNTTVTAIERASQLCIAPTSEFPTAAWRWPRARAAHAGRAGRRARGVHVLRTVDDAQHIAASFDRCAGQGPFIVIGGGFIGLEVAATARKSGLQVTVLEGLSRLMSRVVAPIVSEAAAQVHRAHGVQLVFDARVAELVGAEGEVRAVRMADGRSTRGLCRHGRRDRS